jgi:hypothetical protein
MPTPFREIGGSPQEHYGLEGFRATRQFLVAWEDREAFAMEILGDAAQLGASNWVHYPGKDSAFAVSLDFEPLDPLSPDTRPLGDLTEGLNSYNGSFAKATVVYRTVSSRDREDAPINESGTQLTYSMTRGFDAIEITPAGWTWEDQPAVAVPTDAPLLRMTPYTDHQLTWKHVVRPPWDTICAMQGKLNQGVFLGCPEGTVLFVGSEASKLYRSGLEAGPSEFCWEIHYTFRERAIKQGGNVFGWNYAYRPNPAGWAKLVNATGPLYDSADLAMLFKPAS